MLKMHNIRYSFRLQTQAGFSLVEVVVASAISMVVALGVGRTLLQPIQERNKIEARSQAFSVVAEARHVLERRTLNSDASTCSADLTLPGFNAGNAATETGSPARIRLQRGAAPVWIANGVNLPNDKIRVESVTFANAEVFYRDLANNITYYNGQLFIRTSMLNPGGQRKGFTTQYAQSLIGGITVGVTAAGTVANCALLPEFEETQFCETIVDMNVQPGRDFCVADILSQASLGSAQCAANQMFVGFTHDNDVTLPVCVPQPEQDCRGPYFYLRGVRHNILIPGSTVEVSKPECRTNVARQANARVAPPAPPVQVQPPSPLPPAPPAVDLVNGPGASGGADCPSPAQIDSYTTCIANQQALVASQSDRTIVCPAAPPARCYTPVAIIPPTTPAPAQATPMPPPATTTCQCGTDTINDGEFCGSYYMASYGFLYATSEASMVMLCSNGVLQLQSDTNPSNPSAAPARVVVSDPAALSVQKRSGSYGRVNRTGSNTYAIP